MLTNEYYNDFFELGQQKINFSFFELCLPGDDPVYILKKVMEELDFSDLLANCLDNGRIRYNRIMMYDVVTYVNICVDRKNKALLYFFRGKISNNIRRKFYVYNDTLSKSTNKVYRKVFYEGESGVEYKKDINADYLVAQAFL